VVTTIERWLEGLFVKHEFAAYVGLDWGTQSHEACMMNAGGEVLWSRSIEHNGLAIRTLLQAVDESAKVPPDSIAIGIEVPHRPLVEACLEHGYAVFAINPKQLDRFRDRHSVAGAKDDRHDAFVAASSLGTDRRCFRRVKSDSPDVMRIRELSRLEESLSTDLHRAVNQLYQLLLRYYPQLLQLCPTPDEPWIWTLLEAVPTPEQGHRITIMRLPRILKSCRIRRWTAEQVQHVLKAAPPPLMAGTVEAVSEHALLLLPQLRQLHIQRKKVRDRLEESINRMIASAEPGDTAGCDAAVILSIPGIGPIIGAALLAEASDALANRDYYALRAHAGIAPVTKQSGKTKRSQCATGVINDCAMRCIIGLAAVSNATRAARITMIAFARSGTDTLGRCVALPTDWLVFLSRCCEKVNDTMHHDETVTLLG
jgi:transposase